jgi:hypothetical protein
MTLQSREGRKEGFVEITLGPMIFVKYGHFKNTYYYMASTDVWPFTILQNNYTIFYENQSDFEKSLFSTQPITECITIKMFCCSIDENK